MLVPRLDFLIPIQWMSDTFTAGLWNRDEQKMIIGRVAELNPEWVEEVVNNLEHKLTDVLHDFKGIYSEDEHFVPRISSDILYKVGDKVSVLMRGSKADGHQDAIITSINTEDGFLRKTSKRNTLLSVYSKEEQLHDEVSTYDIRFYGFTAIQEKELRSIGSDIMGDFDENGDINEFTKLN